MILVRNNRLVRVHGKATDSETLRDDPLIVMRHALADRWFAKYRKEMYKQLSAQILQSSKLVAGGSTEPTTDSMEVRWTRDLLRVKRPLVTAMVRSGTELTDSVQFGKSMNYFPGVLGPDVNPFASVELKGKADPIGLEVIGYDSDDVFLHQAQTQNVEAYLQATSKKETATSRKKLDKLYKDANSYWDEKLQRGFTPKQMAKAMTQQGLADSVQRANLMSRTTTMWAYNEGAKQSYINAGIPVMSWVTSNDDALCEFCVQMDGQMIRTGDPFIPAGTELIGIEGGSLNIPEEWSVGHPPLHPMCRCTVVPIIVETDVAIIRVAADKLKEDYTKKVADGTLKDARARRAKLLRTRLKKKPKPPRKKPPSRREPSPFAETKETRKTLEKKKPKIPEEKLVRVQIPAKPKIPVREPIQPRAPRKITKEELERVLDKERQFAKSFSNEHASIVDPTSGRITLRKKGTSDAVAFTKKEVAKMNKQIMVHNHPGKALNFSSDDIMFLSKNGLQETQVITNKYIYKMSRIEGREVASPMKIKRLFNSRMKPVVKELAAKYRGATLTLDEAGQLVIHNVWRSVAKDIGLKYKRIVI